MLEDVRKLIKQAGKQLGLDDAAIEELIKPNSEHIFDIELKNGKTFKAYRVQHNNKNGPYKGGLRFHPNVTLDEVRALSTLMSLKTAAVGLPLGGGKGGVAVNPRELSKEELEELSRKYVQQLYPYIGPDKDVPAPDVNTNSTIIDWMVDEYEKITKDNSHASFTGKSLKLGGSEGRPAATGRGGVIALSELLRLTGEYNSGLTFAMQGFGNVGQFFALTAHTDRPKWQMVAVSDSGTMLYSDKKLDVKELVKIKQNGGRFADYKDSSVQKLPPKDIVSLNVDVLVLAALEDALNKDNVKSVKAKYIVELANGPVTSEAYKELLDERREILPDVVANSGGVIVSYLEWKQNKEGEHWTESKVNKQLQSYMVKAVDEMYDTAKKQKVPLKEAAFVNALKNLL